MSYIGSNLQTGDPTRTIAQPLDADRFSGNNSSLSFTLSRRVGYPTDIEVFVENIQQEPVTAYTVNGVTLTFTEAPPTGTNNVYVVYRQSTNNTQVTLADGSVTYAKLANNIRMFTSDNLTPNGNNSVFTLSEPPADANTVFVTVDGVVQRAPVHYTTSGTTITFTSAPPAGSNVHVRHLGFRTSTTVTAIPVGTYIPQPNIASPTITGTISGSIAVDASGNLGVGTASPATKFHVSDTTTNTVKERIQASTGYVEVGMGGNSGVFDTTATDGIRLRMGGVDKVAIDGNTFSISGLQGIKFQATQSASTDANTLDDYEEGTWTPTLTFGGGSTGITYGGQLGTYVKIGKLVWLNCRVTLTAKGSSTGAARVTGLPFTNQGGSSNGEIQIGSVWYNAFTNASNYHINIRQDASAAPNYMEFRAYAGGSEATVDQTYFNNTSQFSFTIFSMVTA